MHHQMIFVNLPIADVKRTRDYFAGLGYTIDERMSNESCVGVELGPNHYAMMLQRDFFASFHDQTIAEARQCEVLTCLSAESREQVDDLVDKAIAAGGTETRTQDEGFMYGRSYADLDGHVWEIMWMDVEAATKAGAFG